MRKRAAQPSRGDALRDSAESGARHLLAGSSEPAAEPSQSRQRSRLETAVPPPRARLITGHRRASLSFPGGPPRRVRPAPAINHASDKEAINGRAKVQRALAITTLGGPGVKERRVPLAARQPGAAHPRRMQIARPP